MVTGTAATVVLALGLVAQVLFPLPAIRDAAIGRWRPSRVSYSIWTAQGLIVTAVAVYEDAPLGALFVAAGTAVVLTAMFAATFTAAARRAAPDPAPTWQPLVDRTCAVLATCALAALVADLAGVLALGAALALGLSITADGAASTPTLQRGWRGQEPWLPYLGFMLNALAAFVTIREWEFAEIGFVVWQLVLCLTLVAVPYLRSRPVDVAPPYGAHARRIERWPARHAVVGTAAVVAVGALGIAFGVLPRPGEGTGQTGAAVALEAAPVPVAAPAPIAPVAPAAAPAARSAAIPSIDAPISTAATPGFVELTPDGRQVWVAHRGTGSVTVIDTTAGRPVASIPIPAGPPQYVAFCPDGARAYVSVFTDGAPDAPHLVAVVDVATLALVDTIPVGRRPFAATCSADGTHLLVPSHDDGRLYDITTRDLQVRRQVDVAPNPHWTARTPDGRWWTANHESNLVTVLAPDLAGQQRIPLTLDGAPPGVSPHALAVSPDGATLAVVCFDSNQLWLIDTAAGRPVRVVEVGRGPQDVAWTADGARVLTADVWSDTVSVVDAATGTVTARLPVGDGPVSVATSPDGRTAWVAVLNESRVAVLDVAAPTER